MGGGQRSEGEGGPESEGGSERGSGLRGVAEGTREGGGSQAGRRWPPRPRACEHAAAPTGRRKMTGKEAVVGWATGVGPGGLRGERQILLSLSLFSYFCFLFSVVCFDLVLDTKSFNKFCRFLCGLLKYIQSHSQTSRIIGVIFNIYLNINPKQIVIGLIQMTKIIISVTPKILV